MSTRHEKRWGAVLIVLGTLFLLDQVSGFDLGDLISVLWPLALVAWGVWLVLRSRESTGSEPAAPADAPRADSFRASNVFGDLEHTVRTESFRGGNASNVFGDVELDLRAATPAEGEQLLRVDGVFGDVKILIAAGTAVRLQGRTLLGDVITPGHRREGIAVSLDDASPDYAASPRRLRIEASTVMGDVVVKETREATA